MDSNWIKIFSTSAQYKAEIIRGLLIDNDIEAIIVNKQDSAYLFGELEIFVHVDSVLKAKHVLTSHNEL
ncbi:MAG: DUF2007 domain-containing protein [Bacteroidales bacterium]|nr:DUF2007 domain-containing protein [Bacteroidales bacterium]